MQELSALRLLPILIIGPLIYAAMAKLAALLYGRAKMRWLHALVFGLMAMLLGAACLLLVRASGMSISPNLASLLNFALQVAIGGWYFGSRVTTSEGKVFALGRGVLLVLLAYAVVIGLVVVVTLAFFIAMVARPA